MCGAVYFLTQLFRSLCLCAWSIFVCVFLNLIDACITHSIVALLCSWRCGAFDVLSICSNCYVIHKAYYLESCDDYESCDESRWTAVAAIKVGEIRI